MRFPLAIGLLSLLEVSSALRAGYTAPGKLRQEAAQAKTKRNLAKRDDVDPTLLYPEYNISVPVDYFHNETRYEPHSNGSFNLRYWFDASHYKPGGPVFVLLGGETDGSARLPYLQKGIVAQVAQATNGIGVIMEHRYYGTSFPVPDLSVSNMRFLSTEQALADVDYLARNAEFEGVDGDVTAPNTPWIVYGGSYAGAQAAFLRVVYPDTFWGTISSSGVTAAIVDYWQYFEPIRQFAPPDVVKNTQLMVDVVDKIILGNSSASTVQELKDAFGLGGITNNADFANVLTGGIYGWQSTNWDPEVNDPSFWYYQNNMTSTLNNDATESKRSTVQDLLTAAGYEPETATENVLLNAINYFNITSVSGYLESGETEDEYYSLLNASSYDVTDIAAYNSRSWPYQVCTEWGYFQTGDTPKDIMPLVSRLLDLNYTSVSCRLGFNLTLPDVDIVNKYGNFSIEYPRLAIIGGNADPWRPATPLADEAPKRNSTTEEPVWEIAHAVHHWEENGIFPNETTPILPPNQIVYAQEFIVDFVQAWLAEWSDEQSQHYEL